MIIGLVLIILIYVSMITIYHYVMGMEALRATTTPAASVASMMLGPMGGFCYRVVSHHLCRLEY